MTFKSAQTNFEGQQGWNDLAPDALDLAAAARKGGKAKPRSRRVVTPVVAYATTPVQTPPSLATLKAHPPMPHSGLTPPPPTSLSSGSSASSSVASLASEPPMASKQDNTQHDVKVEDVQVLLAEVSARIGSAVSDEKQTTVHKIETELAKLRASHLSFLKQVLDTALNGGKAEARQMLVDYGLLHSNVSAWTVPVRRLVDQL